MDETSVNLNKTTNIFVIAVAKDDVDEIVIMAWALQIAIIAEAQQQRKLHDSMPIDKKLIEFLE